jgi:two-component system, chemotaxis family, sensor kinase CheA
MKYRGGSLPLFSIDQVASVSPMAETENLLVIVFMVGGREIGLLAIGPVDAVETNLNIDGSTLRQPASWDRPSSMIKRRCWWISMKSCVRPEPPMVQGSRKVKTGPGKSAPHSVRRRLQFFPQPSQRLHGKEGFEVIEAEDGLIAWDLLHKNKKNISLVVTDIEMPNMDGFALTRKIKESPLRPSCR